MGWGEWICELVHKPDVSCGIQEALANCTLCLVSRVCQPIGFRLSEALRCNTIAAVQQWQPPYWPDIRYIKLAASSAAALVNPGRL